MNENLLKLLQLAARLPDGVWLTLEADTRGLLKFYLWTHGEIVMSGSNTNSPQALSAAIDRLEAFCDGKLRIVEAPARTTYSLEAVEA